MYIAVVNNVRDNLAIWCLRVLGAAAPVVLWLLMPGATPAGVAALLCMGALAVIAFCNLKCHSVLGEAAVCIGASMMACGIIANLHMFAGTGGATDFAPVLHNTDAARNYGWVLYGMGCSGHPGVPPSGYMHVMVMPFAWLLGTGVTACLVLQMVAGLTALVCTGVLTWQLTADRRTAAVAMCLFCSICYLMAECTVLVKEIEVVAAVGLVAVGMTARRINLWALCAGLLLAFVVRANYLPVLAAGIAATGLARRQGQYVATACAVCAAFVLWVLALSLLRVAGPVEQITAVGVQSTAVVPQHRGYFALMGAYDQLAWWQKILRLPVSAGVQFLVPFFWTAPNHLEFGYTQVYAHYGFAWYAFGGVALYGIARVARRQPRLAAAVLLWGCLCWLLPCYTRGGTVSRYALSAVPLLTPLVAVTLQKCYKKRSFVLWMLCFAVLTAAALAVCHSVQSAYL